MKINALEVLKRIDKQGMIPKRMLFKIRPDKCSHFRYFGWLKIGVVVIGKEPSWIHMHWIEQRIKEEFGYCNELMLFLFTLFHEIGHYYALMEGVENDPLSEYILDILCVIASTREQHLDVQKRYRKLAAEAFCDDFAIEQIKNLFKKERRNKMFYLKKRCSCGGRIMVGNYRDLLTDEIKVGGGVCEKCFAITRLPDASYDEFVKKYCEKEVGMKLTCKLCGGLVIVTDYSQTDMSPAQGQCECCGELHVFPAEDYWPLLVENSTKQEVK